MMTERRYIVGTEAPPLTVGRRVEPQVGQVWHAVDAATNLVACGRPVVTVFDDLVWEARRTAVLCQACLRAAAGW